MFDKVNKKIRDLFTSTLLHHRKVEGINRNKIIQCKYGEAC